MDGYEAHMLQNIEGAEEFYPFTAQNLPLQPGAKILDLGCGTGLELEYYFAVNPDAKVTGVDLSAEMLQALKEKFPHKQIKLIQGSYFDLPFELESYDGAVSVESLHHFTQAEKSPLYNKLWHALKPGCTFLLTDYFALSDEQELSFRQEWLRLRQEAGICDEEFYHFDTPLTVEHEVQALQNAGFASVQVLKNWGATYCLKATK